MSRHRAGNYEVSPELIEELLTSDEEFQQTQGRLLATGIMDTFTAFAQNELLGRKTSPELVGRTITVITASMLANILRNMVAAKDHAGIIEIETGNFRRSLTLLTQGNYPDSEEKLQ
jgi:hypothetical protein